MALLYLMIIMIVRSISTLLAKDLCKVITMTDGSSALPRTEDNMANIRKHEDDVVGFLTVEMAMMLDLTMGNVMLS